MTIILIPLTRRHIKIVNYLSVNKSFCYAKKETLSKWEYIIQNIGEKSIANLV